MNDARVSAESPGTIQAFNVQVGDAVEQGAVLASIDCREHEINADIAAAELDVAQARLGLANTQLANARQLSAKQGISQEQLEERRASFAGATAEVEKARASLAAAKRLVANCEVKAPFAGIVVERIASVGDYVSVGTPLVRLLDTSSLEVAARVQQQDLIGLSESLDLTFFNRLSEYPVTLRSVLPAMEGRLRSFEVRLAFTDAHPASGTTGRLRWKSPSPHIPSEYLIRREDNLGIFVFGDGTALFQAIPDAREGRPARVSMPGETMIILDGRHVLEHGEPVSVKAEP